jgi:membrane-bound serine protease (ClpP class)
VRKLLILILLVTGLGSVLANPAAAQETGDAGFVDIVEVDGLIDPVVADFVQESLEDAEREGALWVVFQMNSSGSVLNDEELADLLVAVRDSPVRTSVWIGPAGAKATGGAAQLVGVVDDIAISPGSKLGDMGEPVIDGLYGGELGQLSSKTIGYDDALATPQVRQAPVIVNHLPELDGFEFFERADGDDVQQIPLTLTRFKKLPLTDQVFHTVASPAIAYLLLVVGMALLVFELYTAGVGIAGVIGAGCFILGAYGIAVLPARGWAVALLVFAQFGFAVDVQAGVPRAWSAIASISLIGGTLFLYDGVSLSWITMVVGVLGILFAMIAGMPTMVRTRFATPTIGREWMIGETGEAVDDVSPEGVVTVKDALWRARANRATPIAVGDTVRVVGIDGLVLEVEPEEGGAKDYRERG